MVASFLYNNIVLTKTEACESTKQLLIFEDCSQSELSQYGGGQGIKMQSSIKWDTYGHCRSVVIVVSVVSSFLCVAVHLYL